MPVSDPALKLRSAKRIAIVMLSAIGDAVHVLPVIRRLKAFRSELEVTWVIQPVPWQLVGDHPSVDRFLIMNRPRGAAFVPAFLRNVAALRRESFDLVIGLQVYLKAGLLLASARSDTKLGFDRARARDLQWIFSTHRIPAHPPQHVLDQYFEFLDYLHVPRCPVSWGLELTAAECAARDLYFSRFERPACAVVLGSSRPEKDWPADRYARLLEVLESDFGFEVLLVGGPSASERATAADVIARTSANPRLELGDGLRRLLYLLAGSHLVISPDTGPLHIARAMDVPVVGLYGYTNPKRSGPYRKYTDLVADGYARYPGEDYPLRFEYRRDGMQRVTVDMVSERVAHACATYVRA